jgi:hypothetical protein
MKIKTLLSIVLISSLFSMSASLSFAQSNPRYVPLGSATGVLYTPDSGVYSHVGIIQSHPTSNNFACGTDWANRGFMALCLNTRYFNNWAEGPGRTKLSCRSFGIFVPKSGIFQA